MSRLRAHGAGEDSRLRAVAGILLVGGAFLAVAWVAALGVGGATARAALPGQNGRIACEGARGSGPGVPSPGFPSFVNSRNEIYTMKADGSDLKLLTDNTVADIDPSFSPDGKKIAFSSARESSAVAVHTMNPDGTDVRRLLFIPGQSTQPNFSPDGSSIVFMDGSRGGFEITRVNLASGALTPITTNPAIDGLPSWSPDGSKIAFDSTRTAPPPFNFQVYTTSAANGDAAGVTKLTSTDPADPGDNSYSPHWAPDGARITFLADRDGNTEVYSMKADGTDQRRLTSNATDNPATLQIDESDDLDPAYSPDGTKIVFESARSGDYEVYTMDSTDGGGVTRLTNSPGFDGRCEWQPVRPAAAAPPTTPPPPRPVYPQPASPFADCPALTANVIRGTAAANVIKGTSRADRIFAGTGNDDVQAVAGDDCVDLGPGADRGDGGLGADLMLGGLGADRMGGAAGSDRLRGGPSADRLVGGLGNDNLQGQSGGDRLTGQGGRDRIAGGQGNDRMDGNSGNDSIAGNSGRDRLKGSTGRDRLSGGSGNDSIDARDGRRDRISCGRGRDTVRADRVDRLARDCERISRRR